MSVCLFLSVCLFVQIPLATYIKTKEPNRVYCQDYRKTIKKGYNLLQKWVPGTAKLSRTEILEKTVKYIQELEKTHSDSAEALIPQDTSIPKPGSSEEEKLLRSSDEEEEFLMSPEEEMKLLASPEELPDFNNMEDFIQWVEL